MILPMLALAQVLPGSYAGTLSCGELLDTPSRPGWSDKVQIEIQGSQLTWSRLGINKNNGSAEYRETGTSYISSQGKVFIDAEGKYLPGSTRSGSWITHGELTIENEQIVGQRLTQVDSNRTRILRNCTVSIPVQTTAIQSQSRSNPGASTQGTATVRIASTASPVSMPQDGNRPQEKQAAVQLPLASPAERQPASVSKQAVKTTTPSIQAKTQASLPVAGPAYLDAAEKALATPGDRITKSEDCWRLSPTDVRCLYFDFAAQRIAELKAGDLRFVNLYFSSKEVVARWRLGGGEQLLSSNEMDNVSQAIYRLVDQKWDSTLALKRQTDQRNELAQQERLKHIKSMDGVTDLLVPMAQAIEKMKRDPRCRVQEIVNERQLDSFIEKLAKLEAIPLAQNQKPWRSYAKTADNLSNSATESAKACTRQ